MDRLRVVARAVRDLVVLALALVVAGAFALGALIFLFVPRFDA